MTNNQLTREENVQAVFDLKAGYTLGLADVEILKRVARIALAALDSEPVGEFYEDGPLNWYQISDGDRVPDSRRIPLYRHAQPAPVVPDELNTRTANDVMNEHLSWKDYGDAEVFCIAWNACRAAMLQELKKSAGTEAICRGDENVQVLHTKSPAQSDCCPAQNHVSPEQNGDVPAQSQGWIQVSEQMPPSRHEVLVGCCCGEKPLWCCKWATYIPGHPDAQSSGWLIPGASWTPTHWMALPAGPQEVNHG
ncbi:DUF551 domain-containing protein [Klebsiella pneumoniae]